MTTSEYPVLYVFPFFALFRYSINKHPSPLVAVLGSLNFLYCPAYGHFKTHLRSSFVSVIMGPRSLVLPL